MQIYALAFNTSSSVVNLTTVSLTKAHCRSPVLEPEGAEGNELVDCGAEGALALTVGAADGLGGDDAARGGLVASAGAGRRSYIGGRSGKAV